MQSIILVSKNRNLAKEKIENICEKEEISNFDRTELEFEKAVGIKDIIQIQEKLFLKPVKSKNKAVIINATSGLTTQAQNALLKILEEPPQNTFIIISIENKDDIIPTVLSRCQIIDLKEKKEFTEEELKTSAEKLIILLTGRAGEKLKLAQDVSKTKEETISFLEKIILISRNDLIKNPDNQKSFEATQKIIKTYNVLRSTNATGRLVLENLFLSL